MQTFRRALVLKLLVLTVAAFVVATLVFIQMPTTNAVGGPNVCTYYSDATYKTVVGARGTGCCNTVINWGITTAYKKCQPLFCTQNICPN